MSKIFLNVISEFVYINLNQLKSFDILSVKETKAKKLCKYFRKRRFYGLTNIPFYVNWGCVKKAKYKVILRYKKFPVCFTTYFCGYHIKRLKHEQY